MNTKMDTSTVGDDLVAELRDTVPMVAADAVSPTRVVVTVGAGVPDVVLDPTEITSVHAVTASDGRRAVRIASWDRAGRPVIVLVHEGDVSFAPDPIAAKAKPKAATHPMARPLAELPPVMGYHDLARLIATGAEGITDHDGRLAHAMAVLAGIAGARRAGLDTRSLEEDLERLMQAVLA
ncbi:MAG: hypothetical protein ACR2JF_18260 [Iamia sp.]